jgi:5-formyltetrahydrofolate cyclo-ligase
MTEDDSRAGLRRTMRARRRAIPRAQLDRATAAALRHLKSLNLPRPGCRIALFHPFEGELGTAPVAAHALRLRCRLYLPVITDLQRRKLIFVEWRPGHRLVRTRTGIHEPRERHRRSSPQCLDLVLVPLVAFDARCNRIGTGGGFYDRHFAFRLRRSVWRRPLLVGWAHDFQRIPEITTAPWDVPLDLVVTDRGVYRR